MNAFAWILLATIANSLVALAGAVTLGLKEKTLDKILHALVGFSAGALLAGAFFHLLAEAIEQIPVMDSFYLVFAGFVLFFVIERCLHWHHCHKGKCDVHAVSYLILFGDGVHNFIDGIVIAASFMIGIPFGILTTLLIMSHELPQELGDFGVLVYSGFGRRKALVYNLLAQMTSIIGGIVGFFFVGASGLAVYMLPFAAGGFIYIGASDLIPELHKQESLQKTIVSFALFLAGIALMISTKLFLD